MSMRTNETFIIEFDDDTRTYTLGEFCDACSAATDAVVELVESGILVPQGAHPAEWRFSMQALFRYHRARRLQRDLEINLPGIALSLELLEDLEVLRRRVRALEQRLAKLTGGP